MAEKIIAQDGTCQIYDGGAFSSSGPSYGGSIAVTAFIKEFTYDATINTVDGRGWGDFDEANRPTFRSTMLDVTLLIENTGPVAITEGGYGKITWTPLGGITPVTKEGIWTKQSFKSNLDQYVEQSLSLKCNADTD